MNTRNRHPRRASDGLDRLEAPPRATRPTVVEWSEIRAWPECPADEAPCDRADGDCEVCGRSAVTYG
jgi:hypothetical protein